jgi:hypothetical protein
MCLCGWKRRLRRCAFPLLGQDQGSWHAIPAAAAITARTEADPYLDY